MANPVATGGLKAIMRGVADVAGDEVRRAVRQEHRSEASNVRLRVESGMEAEGVYGFDSEGQVQFRGTISGLPEGVPAELGAGAGKTWDSTGAGRLKVWFRVVAEVVPDEGKDS